MDKFKRKKILYTILENLQDSQLKDKNKLYKIALNMRKFKLNTYKDTNKINSYIETFIFINFLYREIPKE